MWVARSWQPAGEMVEAFTGGSQMALNQTTVTKTAGGGSWTGEEDGKEGEAYGGNNVIETERRILNVCG